MKNNSSIDLGVFGLFGKVVHSVETMLVLLVMIHGDVDRRGEGTRYRNGLGQDREGKARVESAMSRSDKAGTRRGRKDMVYCELQTED